MATDSTNLPQGGMTVDAGSELAGAELEPGIQLAQAEPAQPAAVPDVQANVLVIQVRPGQVVTLPVADAEGVPARIGPEGNLAFVIDGRTIILQGYVKADEERPIKIVTNDGDEVVPAELVADTDVNLEIETAAGGAAGPQGDTATGSGIFVPFAAGPGLGGIGAEGVLDPTALDYKNIDDDARVFLEENDDPEFGISFDIPGGIVNEDDLPGDQDDPQQEQAAAKLVVKDTGNDGAGNDPFDTTDREDQDGTPDDVDGVDANGNSVDPDREPLETVATVTVDFGNDGPGTLAIDTSLLPADLTSEGEPVVFEVVPAQAGVHGNGILAFVDSGLDGKYDEGVDRLVFEVHVDKDVSPSLFNVKFTLHDNLDNPAPTGLLGADEDTQALPVNFVVTDDSGDTKSGQLPFGVQDDKPAFGQVVGIGEDIEIVSVGAGVVHDETLFPQGDADDQSLFNPDVSFLGLDLADQITNAGFSLPFGDSKGATLGAAQTQVIVSFGADGAAQFNEFDPNARDSVFGAISGSGENEHPFELFMIDPSKGSSASETNLTAGKQQTNAFVTWDGADLPVYLEQIDANTIVGYVVVIGEDGEEQIVESKETVFVIDIQDNGVLSLFQVHQINHTDPTSNDESLTITGVDGVTPLVHVRATDADGDHVVQPVNIEIQDSGPKFITVCYDDKGRIDEDRIPVIGNQDHQAGDNKGGASTGGEILFAIGTDKPGTLSIDSLTITDDKGNVIPLTDLAGGRDVELVKSGPDGDGIVTWTGVVKAGETGAGGEVFVFTLDTAGPGMGEFNFELKQGLSHPFTDDPADDADTATSFEDNLHFDFKVTATDVDGDTASGNIKINVDDDSPDPCEVEITIDSGDNGDFLLTHDETASVQDNGNSANDPDASGQDEDDVTPAPADFAAFEAANGLLTNLGYAATTITVDLDPNNTLDAEDAIGADRPGVVSAVSIVGPDGNPVNGAATNLYDTATGNLIFLYTVTVGTETFVVGRVGSSTDPLTGANSVGAISFALHTTEAGALELGQYLPIQHNDTNSLDEAVVLRPHGNEGAAISLQVTVSDADGDTIVVTKPLDGYEGGAGGIAFQDDGPAIIVSEGQINLAVDESIGGDGTDLDTPEDNGVADGPAVENDETTPVPAALSGLGTVIGAAVAQGSALFSYTPGSDGEKSHAYSLTISNAATGLTAVGSGQAITLVDMGVSGGLQVVHGKTANGDIAFALSIDVASGEVSIAQYLAIDHGNTEAASGAHDELARLAADSLHVTLTVTDNDNDTVVAHKDISSGVTFDDDAPDVTIGSGTLTLAMDETVSLSDQDADFPEADGDLDGNVPEGDALLHGLAVLFSGLPVIPLPIGAAQGNVQGLFSVDYGSDKAAGTTYALQITSSLTNLFDTASGQQIELVKVGDIVVGQTVGSHDVVFAVTADPNNGQIVSAQYRAINHGAEEGVPGAHDEVAYLGTGALAVVATATDKDGDSDSQSVDIGHSISFDDDGPKFVKVSWGIDFDSTAIVNGVGLIDEEDLSGGKDGGPGDGNGDNRADGTIVFDFGSDQPGSLALVDVKLTDGSGNVLDLSALTTADGHAITVTQTTDPATDVITWIGKDATDSSTVFTLTLDGKGANLGDFAFTLSKPIAHPDSNNSNADDASDFGTGSYEDNLNFDFTVRGADGDGDSDVGHIKVTVDDDSPKVTTKEGSLALGMDETKVSADTGDFQDLNNADGTKDGPRTEGDEHSVALPASLTGLGIVIGAAQVSGAAAFSISAGADGAASVTFGLAINNVASGLTDTLTNQAITLVNVGGVIQGQIPGGIVVFAATVNPTTGELSIAQYRAVRHSGPDNPSQPDEVLQLGSNKLSLTVTVTDKDGDTVTQSKDLGSSIRFEDDGPAAVDDTDRVFEGDPQHAYGNVVTGSNTGFGGGTDSNLEDGKEDAGGTDGTNPTSVVWTDKTDGVEGDGKIVGKYGTLLVDASGGYEYVLDQANPDVIKLGKDATISEDFLYTVADKDGDSDDAKLTITIVGKDEGVEIKDLTPAANGGDTVVDEKGLPTRPGELAGSGEHADADDTNNSDTTETNIGDFTIKAPDGIKFLTINGQSIIANDVYTDNVKITTAYGELTVTDYDSGTGKVSYTYTLKDNAQHDPAGGTNPNQFFDDFKVSLEDTDGSHVDGTLSVHILDDLPSIDVTATSEALVILNTQDAETDGVPTPSDTDTSTADFSGVFKIGGSYYGADGAGSTTPLTYALGFAVGFTEGQASGLKIGGADIFLWQDPSGKIIGSTSNSEIGINAGNTVFEVSLAADGTVTLTQHQQVDHAVSHTSAPYDIDEVALANGKITLTASATITDKDGDAATDKETIDLGGNLVFDDDGPSISVSFVDGKDSIDDEGAPLAGTAGIEGAEIGTDVTGKSNTVNFTVTSSFGADGAGTAATFDLAAIQTQNSALRAVDGTADGAKITFSLSGGDIVGKVDDATSPLDGAEVLRVHNTGGSNYEVKESSPLFHSGQGEDNDLTFNVVMTITDKDGDSATTTAVAKIDDDTPNATSQQGEAEAQPKMNTNLLLVLDDSGSMNEGTSLQNVNKLAALQAAVNELLEQYGNLGTVKVCFVRFDSSASTLTSGGDVWLTLDQAKEVLATLSQGGNTNYDDALLEAIGSYITNDGTDHKLLPGDVTGPIQNVGYFISDGEPNNNNDWSSDPYSVPGWVAPPSGAGVGGTDGVAGINTEEEYLQNFLNQEDIKMYSIGIGNGINSSAAENLKNISYDGTGAGNDDDANLYIELTDLAQLSQTLVGTIVVPVTGNVGAYGADGGWVSQITLAGGLTITRDQAGDFSSNAGASGATITVGGVGSTNVPVSANTVRVALSTGSAFYVNMLTGAWEYVPAPGDTASYNFGFTLTDNDGDTDSAVLTVSTEAGGLRPIVRDDNIITNIAGAWSITDKALLWNDSDKDGQTISISANQADITNVAAGTTVTRDNPNGEIDVSDNASTFTYKGISADGSDTGKVSITEVGGNTLTGNGLDNVIIAGGGNDTLRGFQGNDVLMGGAGDDVLAPGTGNDLVDGGTGDDAIDFSDISGNWNFTLDPSGNGTANVAGTDTYTSIEGVKGGSGNNTLTGNAVDNLLDGGTGTDTLVGAAGSDTYSFDVGDGTDTVTDTSGTADKIVINGNVTAFQATRSGNDLVIQYDTGALDNQITVTGHFSGNTIEQIQITGGTFAGVWAISLDNVDPVMGTVAAELLAGTGGADTFNGQGGNDLLTGAANGDTYDFVAGDGTDIINDTGGADTIKINGKIDQFDAALVGNSLVLKYGAGLADQITVMQHYAGTGNGVETLTFTDATGAFTGTYNLVTDGSGTLTGTVGNDVVAGSAGGNTLDGGAGADLMFGQGGNDTYIVDNLGDRVFEQPGGGTDTVQSTVSYTLGANVENLTLSDAGGALNGIGNTGTNTITGNSSGNVLDGGNDAVADTLSGDDGNDTLIFRGAINVDTYSGGTGTDILDASNLANLDFTGFTDTKIESIETLRLTGGAGTTVTLTAADVVNFEGGTFNPDGGALGNQEVLRIEGDNTDTVNLVSGAGDTWLKVTSGVPANVPAGFDLWTHVGNTGSDPTNGEDTYVLIQQGVTVVPS